MSLLNTDIGKELDHMAQMLSMARDYARNKDLKEHFLLNQSQWSQ